MPCWRVLFVSFARLNATASVGGFCLCASRILFQRRHAYLHYFTARGLFDDALYKLTGTKIELFSEIDMHMGGVCRRHCLLPRPCSIFCARRLTADGYLEDGRGITHILIFVFLYRPKFVVCPTKKHVANQHPHSAWVDVHILPHLNVRLQGEWGRGVSTVNVAPKRSGDSTSDGVPRSRRFRRFRRLT